MLGSDSAKPEQDTTEQKPPRKPSLTVQNGSVGVLLLIYLPLWKGSNTCNSKQTSRGNYNTFLASSNASRLVDVFASSRIICVLQKLSNEAEKETYLPAGHWGGVAHH